MFDQTYTEREHHTNFWVKTYFVRSEALDRSPPVKSILPRKVSELDLPSSLSPAQNLILNLLNFGLPEHASCSCW